MTMKINTLNNSSDSSLPLQWYFSKISVEIEKIQYFPLIDRKLLPINPQLERRFTNKFPVRTFNKKVKYNVLKILRQERR